MKASIVPLLILAMSLTLPGCARTTPPTPAELHPTVATAQTTAGTRAGLRGTYFDQMNLTGPSTERVDPNVNFAWAGQAPAPGIAPSTYSARWEGRLTPRFSETYTFFLTSHDGARLSIGGQEIITQWKPGLSKGEARVTLTAGVPVDIKLEYFLQASRQSTLRLDWQSTSQPRETIPASQFTQPATPLRADPALGPVTLRVDGKTVPAGQPLPPVPDGEYNIAYAFDGETFKGAQFLLSGETGGTINATSTVVAQLAQLAFVLRTQDEFRIKVIEGLRADPRLSTVTSSTVIDASMIQVLFDVVGKVDGILSKPNLNSQNAVILQPVQPGSPIRYETGTGNQVKLITSLPYKVEFRVNSGAWADSTSKTYTMDSVKSYTGVGLADHIFGGFSRSQTIDIPQCFSGSIQSSIANIYDLNGNVSMNSVGISNSISQLTALLGPSADILSSISPENKLKLAQFLLNLTEGGSIFWTALKDAQAIYRGENIDANAFESIYLFVRNALQALTTIISGMAPDSKDLQALKDWTTFTQISETAIKNGGSEAKAALKNIFVVYDIASALTFATISTVEGLNGQHYNEITIADDDPACKRPTLSVIKTPSLTAQVGLVAEDTLIIANTGEPDSFLPFKISAPGLAITPTEGTISPGEGQKLISVSYTCLQEGVHPFTITVSSLYVNPSVDEPWEPADAITVETSVTCTIPLPKIADLYDQKLESQVGGQATGIFQVKNVGDLRSILKYSIGADEGVTLSTSSGSLSGQEGELVAFKIQCTQEGHFTYNIYIKDQMSPASSGFTAFVHCTRSGPPHLVVTPIDAAVSGWGSFPLNIENTGVDKFFGGFRVDSDPSHILRIDPNQIIPLNDLGTAQFGLGVDCPGLGTYSASLYFFGNADNTPLTVPVTIHCQ